VILQTPTHRIEGNIHIRPGERLKDEINQAEPFFAMTEAVIFDTVDREVLRTDFLIVYREQIIWLLPKDQITSGEDEENGGDE
jgi:hypothetical protein